MVSAAVFNGVRSLMLTILKQNDANSIWLFPSTSRLLLFFVAGTSEIQAHVRHLASDCLRCGHRQVQFVTFPQNNAAEAIVRADMFRDLYLSTFLWARISLIWMG